MSPNADRELILSEKLATTFIGQAMRERIVDFKDSKKVIPDSTITPLQRKYMMSRMGLTTVMDALVLYERVVLYGLVDSVDLRPLTDAGVVQVVEPPDVADFVMRAEYGTRPLEPAFRRNIAFKPEFRDALLAVDGLVTAMNLELYPKTLQFSRKRLRELCSMLTDTEEASRRYSSLDKRERVFIHLLEYHRILDSYQHLVSLLQLSAERQAPAVFCNAVRTPPATGGRIRDIQASGPNELVYRVLIEEVTSFPHAQSISDALRLREDRRIHAFRRALADWGQRLAAGDEQAERELRRELRDRNRELAQIRPARQIGGIVTLLGLPVALAGPLAAAGLGLSVIGACIEIGALATQWRNRWLLQGALDK